VARVSIVSGTGAQVSPPSDPVNALPSGVQHDRSAVGASYRMSRAANGGRTAWRSETSSAKVLAVGGGSLGG
jgi:hypothetical protein